MTKPGQEEITVVFMTTALGHTCWLYFISFNPNSSWWKVSSSSFYWYQNSEKLSHLMAVSQSCEVRRPRCQTLVLTPESPLSICLLWASFKALHPAAVPPTEYHFCYRHEYIQRWEDVEFLTNFPASVSLCRLIPVFIPGRADPFGWNTEDPTEQGLGHPSGPTRITTYWH